MKKVLLIVIDAFATRIVVPALRAGKLPNFQQIVGAGRLQPNCLSIFPSITPAATCSIVTGCYPAEHKIAGAFWFDPQSAEIAYFGDEPRVIIREGIDKFFYDFLIRLNHQFLQSETLFEDTERHGMRAACLNYLWFHGIVPHEIKPPFLLRLLPGLRTDKTIRGPTICCLGDFVTSTIELTRKPLRAHGGMTRRYGFSDECTFELLLQLAKDGPLPNFTLAYFPDNDYESHDRGPAEAVDVLMAIDEQLSKLFAVYGGLDEMLKEVAIIITGDHSQSDLFSNPHERTIRLQEVLHDFTLVPPGEKWEHAEDVLACTNMRAAQIYLKQPDTQRDKVIEALLKCERIDQVIWRGGPDNHREPDGSRPQRFCIATPAGLRLEFWPCSDGPNTTADDYGAAWSWLGDLAVVDASVSNGRLTFGDYPNAFERIAAGFADVDGEIWVTAKIGHDFGLPGTESFSGGSHGSLHALDSTAPLITAGVPSDVALPKHPRVIDVAPLCLAILGLTPRRPVDASAIEHPLRNIPHGATPTIAY